MKVKVNSDKCKECGFCVKYCPKKAIAFSEVFNVKGYKSTMIDDEKCIACGVCYTMCPDAVFEILENQ